MTAAFANLILSKPYGFITLDDLPDIIAHDRLCWLLVRCGAQHGRFSAPAQNVAQLITTIEAAGDWVRDVSFPISVLEEARANRTAQLQPQPEPVMPEHARARLHAHVAAKLRTPRHSMDDVSQPIEGQDWICTGNFEGSSCGTDADSGL